MKKYVVALFVLIALPLSAFAAEYEEGKHYEVLPGQATNTPEVVEFFSYFCSHCYNFEPMVKKLEAGVKGARFWRAHIYSTEPIANAPEGYIDPLEVNARGFAIAQVLKVVEPVSQKVYKENAFKGGDRILTVEDMRQVFIDVGVKAKDFDAAYNSFPVRSIMARMGQKTKKLGVNRTPTVVVNGKYRVLPSGLGNSANFAEDYVKLVNYLAQKKD